MRFSDSHCHLATSTSVASHRHCMAATSDTSDDGLTTTTTTLARTPRELQHIVVCGTHPNTDWTHIAALAARSARLARGGVRVLVGFGVHPWHVPELPPRRTHNEGDADDDAAATSPASTHAALQALMTQLEQHLRAHPSAIVGEVGLDKLRGPSADAQAAALLAQLRLAARYQRPVSLHCVRHYGLLLQLLRDLPAQHTPPALIVHAFTGSYEVARELRQLHTAKTQPPRRERTLSAAATDEAGGGSSAAPPRPGRVFFGIGSRTSLRVADMTTRTLPMLLQQPPSHACVLLETDAYYTYMDTGDAAGDGAECVACDRASVYEPLRQLATHIAALTRASTSRGGDDGNSGDDGDVCEAAFARAFATVLSLAA